MARGNITPFFSPHLAGKFNPAEFSESSVELLFSAKWNSLNGTTYDSSKSIIMDSKRARVQANIFSWLYASDEFDINVERINLATKRHKIRYRRNEDNSYYHYLPRNIQKPSDEPGRCKIYSVLENMSTYSYNDLLESMFEGETFREAYEANNKHNRKSKTFHDYFTAKSRMRTAIHYFF